MKISLFICNHGEVVVTFLLALKTKCDSCFVYFHTNMFPKLRCRSDNSMGIFVDLVGIS